MFNCVTGKLGILTREINKAELPYLENDLRKGIVVFEYIGCDYGTLLPGRVAVCLEPNEWPFIGIPKEAIEWDNT